MRAKIQDRHLVQFPAEVIEHLGDPRHIDLDLAEDGSIIIRPITEIKVQDSDLEKLLESRGTSPLDAVQTYGSYVVLSKDVELASVGVSLKAGMRAFVTLHLENGKPVMRGRVALQMEDPVVRGDDTIAVFPSALTLLSLPAQTSEIRSNLS